MQRFEDFLFHDKTFDLTNFTLQDT